MRKSKAGEEVTHRYLDAIQAGRSHSRRGRLQLCLDPRPEPTAVFWRINGFRARLMVWTAEEWHRLERRPADAQYHPSGVWCALRLE